ncbi:MAG: hypothetical protein LAT55_11965 [Opitutales bacterium]|nr:hypothetical protein [Opitutales bacterium]
MSVNPSFHLSRAPRDDLWLLTRQTPNGRENHYIPVAVGLPAKRETPPVAAESFALNPQQYHDLLDRAETMLRQNTAEPKPMR